MSGYDETGVDMPVDVPVWEPDEGVGGDFAADESGLGLDPLDESFADQLLETLDERDAWLLGAIDERLAAHTPPPVEAGEEALQAFYAARGVPEGAQPAVLEDAQRLFADAVAAGGDPGTSALWALDVAASARETAAFEAQERRARQTVDSELTRLARVNGIGHRFNRVEAATRAHELFQEAVAGGRPADEATLGDAMVRAVEEQAGRDASAGDEVALVRQFGMRAASAERLAAATVKPGPARDARGRFVSAPADRGDELSLARGWKGAA